jgi:hypothetical protein
MVLGLRIFEEITAMTILRMTLVMDDTKDAATCSKFVTRIMLETEEQKALTVASVYITSMLLLQ